MNLWFENRFGERRIIADCSTPDEVSRAIEKFINECNAKKNSSPYFKFYYTRCWPEDSMVKYDVGSWSEFFYQEGPFEAYIEGAD